MLPGTEIVERLKGYHFDPHRSALVYRQGVKDGTFPKSGGRNRREPFSVKDFGRLVLSVGCGATIEKSTQESGILCALQDENGNRLDAAIAGFIESVKPGTLAARNGQRNYHTAVCSMLLNSRIEIDQDFHRVKIVIETDNGSTKEMIYGPIQDRDSTMIGLRNVAIISGTVLYRLAVGYHFNSWDADEPIAFDGADAA